MDWNKSFSSPSGYAFHFAAVLYGLLWYGAAIAIRVSYFMGQRDYKAVQLSSSAGFHLIMLIAFIVAIPVFIYRNQMGSSFLPIAKMFARW